MDLKQIRYFVAVAELGNVTRAAERLFIAQPALSRQIQALEEELGVALFERKNRRLSLTYAGDVYLNQMRSILQQLGQANTLIEEVGKGAVGILRVAATPIPMFSVVLPAVARFRENWPRFHIKLTELPTGSAIPLIEQGQADLAVGSPLTNVSDLSWTVLYDARLFALVSIRHPLASRPFVTVQELSHENLLLHKTSETTRLTRNLLLHIPDIRASAVLESDLSENLLRAAELQLGIAVVTDSLEYSSYALRAIPIHDGDNQVSFQVVAAWDAQRNLPGPTHDLIALLKEFGAHRPANGYVPWIG
jgi:LysR family cyn operon transcriptional activator